MRVLQRDDSASLDALVAQHVAVPEPRPTAALVRLNMIESADGGSALAGRSGGLGNDTDHAVFGALRAAADAVIVGMRTVISEHYGAPSSDALHLYVIASRPDVSGNPELFASGRATLVLPPDADAPSADVDVLELGTGLDVDLRALVDHLAGKVVMAEGGPTIAGRLATLGLLDELFLTVSPRVIAGDVARVVHGADADPTPWLLRHAFADDDDFLFLRYARRAD
ncbi:MAG TPA: dihydrofolate reductase family protein [Acidimicrobiia bacterium]|nr:dihydrofolate reductase family protein [Acidimicrobiia bacterium]